MTRIIAGTAGGRRLAVPGHGTRPTSDRVREALFSSLESMLREDGREWSDLRVLDGFAGSGALGLESLSRGAAAVLLVERNRQAAAIIRRNIEAVALPGARLVTGSMAQVAATTPDDPVSLVFLDPPYDVSATALQALLASLDDHGWLAGDAVIVVERPAADPVSPLPGQVEQVAHRRYGDTALWYGRRGPAPAEEVSSA